MKDVIYLNLASSLQKLRKGCEKRHYTLSNEEAEADSEDAATLYDIINVEQLQV